VERAGAALVADPDGSRRHSGGTLVGKEGVYQETGRRESGVNGEDY